MTPKFGLKLCSEQYVIKDITHGLFMNYTQSPHECYIIYSKLSFRLGKACLNHIMTFTDLEHSLHLLEKPWPGTNLHHLIRRCFSPHP